MTKIDLNLLPIAIALYDEGSVSRAAQLLGMSQPAVSMALRKLRAAYHDPLFVRARDGVTRSTSIRALATGLSRLPCPMSERWYFSRDC